MGNDSKHMIAIYCILVIEFGLASYLYARDSASSWRGSEAQAYGIVGLTTGLISTEMAQLDETKQLK
jgi:hypothetical protein